MEEELEGGCALLLVNAVASQSAAMVDALPEGLEPGPPTELVELQATL